MTGSYAGKRVVILGLAREGTALARYLAEEGAQVTVSDLQGPEALQANIQALSGLEVSFVLGEHPHTLLDQADLLALSGGVPRTQPLVREAMRRGIPLTNEAQIFLEKCLAPVIGITGSAGKTTTTTLVGEMCKAAGFTTWVGGNIGTPLIKDVRQIQPTDKVVMELSSFQLELMTRSPHIAAVLNITPNHLDRHTNMAEYVAAKARILLYQTPEDVAVLGYDNAWARALAWEARGRVLFFSLGQGLGEGAFRRNGDLVLRVDGQERVICRTSQVRLLGDHNLQNVLAACAIAYAADVPLQAMQHVARTFSGVEHRLELVRTHKGVRWYDDSIATAPERTVAALKAFNAPIILLAGGRDKNLPWDEMAALTRRKVRHLIVFGEAADKIVQAIRESEAKDPNGAQVLRGIHRAVDLADAVHIAARLARPGDVVLLSPGGTSFDAFRDFAERGDKFKEYVRAL
jgi:UDP-N-acetylmuramoylalanine--D-glutamate ligase